MQRQERQQTFQIGYEALKSLYEVYSHAMYSKEVKELNPIELQNVIAGVIKKEIIKSKFESSRRYFSTKKIAIYFSMEFLIGRIVLDALTNTGIKEMTSQILEEEGVDIAVLEEIGDAALGNGGLGRLAACFVESAASNGYPLYGYGLYYKYGLFKQEFRNNMQFEVPDDWAIFGEPWFKPCYAESIIVKFKNTSVKAVPYELPIIGYNQSNIFPLVLWKAEPVEGTNTTADKISDYLYPNDKEDEGRLRIYQEYFFVSATLQRLMKIHLEKHGTLDNFEDYYCFQMNDTHPVFACVEYIRLLEEYGYAFKQASEKAKKCFAYTNHTILPEALEKWNTGVLYDVLPDGCKRVIEDLNQELIDFLIGIPAFKLTDGTPNWEKVRQYELFSGGKIHMANIACYMATAINGVAEIHSEIIKKSTLGIWFELYPRKFTNVTNGVTPRRWIKNANPNLSALFDSLIGVDWPLEFEVKVIELNAEKTNQRVLKEFAGCKKAAKRSLADYIWKHEGISIDPDSIFDCQVKRFHEYKRQVMNAFRILYLYDGIKSGRITDFYNTTFIIGGKAAATYEKAKRYIKLMKDIQDLINNDPDMAGKMKVVFVTNFNVSYGEKIYAAADFSEQISTAGFEASGTGNMKFMMNGAPTIGTMDGANIEIVEMAGRENNYIFGATVEELRNVHYNPSEFMRNSVEMQIISKYLTNWSLHDNYQDILDGLRQNDNFYVMFDLPSYIEISLRAFSDYAQEQRTGDFSYFTAKGFANTANSGSFSSDRCIQDYSRKIWHIEKV